ncbi:hypothetical protein [Micromonospora cathayae]|uniref:Right handed beta helix region n=1 Tax=Micromonospora cathayae TaxID=3028804 RepID=A0ABY7ZXL1_9ACTN|nr:hypothetical protein [Micromonospora sp. HUAS 3]WDZ87767.1 hypothetical protein PVK37_15845 [Micromonospora sp. HUAS 3]
MPDFDLKRRTLLQAAGAAAAVGTVTGTIAGTGPAHAAAPVAAPASEPTEPPRSRVSISHVTESVDDGSSMVVVGEGFSSSSEVWLFKLPKDTKDAAKASLGQPSALPARPPTGAVKAAIVNGTRPQALIVGHIGYPTPAADLSVFPTAVWVRDGDDWSPPYVVNRAGIFFLETDLVVPGETIRVFGRNLLPNYVFRGTDYDYPIALRKVGGGAVHWAQLYDGEGQTRPNYKPYVAQIRMPEDLPDGEYDLSLHGRFGLADGWSNAVRLLVRAKRTLVNRLARHDLTDQVGAPGGRPRTEVVKISEGASYDDNWRRIQDRLDAVGRRGGGIVRLPSGPIAIGRTLRVPDGVVLEGSGRGATRLTTPLDVPFQGTFPVGNLFPSPAFRRGFAGDYTPYWAPHQPLVWLEGGSGVSDLAIQAGSRNFTAVLIGNSDPEKVLADAFVKRVDITVRTTTYAFQSGFSPTNGGIHVVSPTARLVISDCVVDAHEPISMYAGRHAHHHAMIVRNSFSSHQRQDSNIGMIMGWSDSVFEDNELYSGGRGLISQMNMTRVYLCGNRIHEIGGRGNASEVLMAEAGDVGEEVTVTGATGTTVRTSSALPAGAARATSTELYAWVAEGRGFGQYRRIVDNDGNGTLTLDRPWRTVPDTTSKIDIIFSPAVNNLWLNNVYSNGRGYLQPFYGGGFDNVIAGNELRSAGGLSIWSGFKKTGFARRSVGAYNLIYNNMLTGSDALNLYGGDAGTEDVPGGLFANTVRRNQLWSRGSATQTNQYYNIWFSRRDQADPELEGSINLRRCDSTVVEANYIFQDRNGVLARGGKNNVVRYNRMDRVENRILRQEDPRGLVATAPPFENPY